MKTWMHTRACAQVHTHTRTYFLGMLVFQSRFTVEIYMDQCTHFKFYVSYINYYNLDIVTVFTGVHYSLIKPLLAFDTKRI